MQDLGVRPFVPSWSDAGADAGSFGAGASGRLAASCGAFVLPP